MPETKKRTTTSAGSPIRRSWWARLGLPLQVGLVTALIGMALTTVGILRGFVPATLPSIAMALLISGGSWGVVAWAVATAAVDSEEVEPEEGEETAP
ncbi:MAG: hypothetical protein GX605_05560 [Chloroflexi bacterium]|nr:hypothetical protein [Chloroflexota bacterium]